MVEIENVFAEGGTLRPSSDIEYVFVYGTLRPPKPDTPESDTRYYPQIASYVQSVTPAYILQTELYDLGTYPAARPGDSVIYGDLLTVQSQALAIMDRIEGHPTFFQRGRVLVHYTKDNSIEAWIYWAPEALTLGKPRIPQGDWLQRPTEYEVPSPDEEILTDQSKVDSTLQVLVQRFAESQCSWLSTARPDGRVHSAPIWHVWYRGRAYIVTLSSAVKTANILNNPSVVITHPDPINPIIIEGWATPAEPMEQQLQPLFKAKYDWDISTDSDYDIIIEITPTRLLAWGKRGQGKWPGTEVLGVWLPASEVDLTNP